MAVIRQARSAGFHSIEGRGVDRDPAKIEQARRAGAHSDPAVGLVFQVGDPREALSEELEFPADLVLYEVPEQAPERLDALADAAGITVLAAPAQTALT